LRRAIKFFDDFLPIFEPFASPATTAAPSTKPMKEKKKFFKNVRNALAEPGTDVMIPKIFSPIFWAKIDAF
jgi:hypothetical protein